MSTYTLAVAPSGAAAFTGVSSFSFIVYWDSGTAQTGYNPDTTNYVAQITTASDFTGTLISSATRNLWASYGDLTAKTTYYARVKAVNADGIATAFAILDTTRTSPAPPHTDLLIQNVTFSPASGVAGSSVTVNFRVLNQGNAPAAATHAWICLSADSVLTKASCGSTDPKLSGNISVPGLAAGVYTDISETVAISSDQATGNYYIGAIAAVLAGEVEQSDETNDSSLSTTQFTVVPPYADLIVQNLAASPLSGLAGSTVTVSFRIFNQGPGTASTSTARLLLAPGNAQLADLSVGTILGGAFNDKSATVSIPSSTAFGPYRITVAADFSATANQSDASNDRASVNFHVTTEVKTGSDNTLVAEDGTKVVIPAGSISSQTQLRLSTPADPPKVANDPGIRATSVVREIRLEDGTKQLNKKITITLPYTAGDIAGLKEESLRLFFYDENTSGWGLASNSTVDKTNKTVSGMVNHLSLFRILEFTTSGAPLGAVTNYPNPFSPLRGQTTKIRYSLDQDQDASARIYDSFGMLVREWTFAAGQTGGAAGPNEVAWDGRTGDGRMAAAGAYICVIKSGGKTARTVVVSK